jgi:hypothetical protein
MVMTCATEGAMMIPFSAIPGAGKVTVNITGICSADFKSGDRISIIVCDK